MPGSSPPMARRDPVSRLKSVDLPTLGRPTIATNGALVVWSFSGNSVTHSSAEAPYLIVNGRCGRIGRATDPAASFLLGKHLVDFFGCHDDRLPVPWRMQHYGQILAAFWPGPAIVVFPVVFLRKRQGELQLGRQRLAELIDVKRVISKKIVPPALGKTRLAGDLGHAIAIEVAKFSDVQCFLETDCWEAFHVQRKHEQRFRVACVLRRGQERV